MPIKITRAAELGRPNTRKQNRLEELGRVDAEKAYTGKGKRNLREEKSRIRHELKKGGKVKGPHGFGPKPYLNRPGQSQGTHGGRTGKAKGGHVKSMRKATRGGGAAIR